MATYSKNGNRIHVLKKEKQAMKDINNFSNIIQEMERFDQAIMNYDGVINPDKLDYICKLIADENKIRLSEEQMNIVKKNYK